MYIYVKQTYIYICIYVYIQACLERKEYLDHESMINNKNISDILEEIEISPLPFKSGIYVYIYIYIYICIYMSLCLYTYMNICMYLYMSIHRNIYIDTYTFNHIYSIHINKYVSPLLFKPGRCVSIFMYLDMCEYVFRYVNIYILIYICIYWCTISYHDHFFFFS
jgi:hypothetical protein